MTIKGRSPARKRHSLVSLFRVQEGPLEVQVFTQDLMCSRTKKELCLLLKELQCPVQFSRDLGGSSSPCHTTSPGPLPSPKDPFTAEERLGIDQQATLGIEAALEEKRATPLMEGKGPDSKYKIILCAALQKSITLVSTLGEP